MPYPVLNNREQQALAELYFQLRHKGDACPTAQREAITALRCLKAVHSNAIEDKRVDRIFLQLLLHDAGVEDKEKISTVYAHAASELRGQEKMLRWLESQAIAGSDLTISFLQKMHHFVFEASWPSSAGHFRADEVEISGSHHRPPHHSQIDGLLHQHFETINELLRAIGTASPDTFFEILDLSARAHYLVAHVHPFLDGNGRIARAAGDYVMLRHGLYYDVIMTDYKDMYLAALDECTLVDCTPLTKFLEYSYYETLQRISGFFKLISGP